MPIQFVDSLEDAQRLARQRAYENASAPPFDPRSVGTPPTPETDAENAWTYRKMALRNKAPMFGAAQSAAGHPFNLKVLPLEPGGTTPMVDAKDATTDERRLYEWWSETPAANPGFVTRDSDILVVEVLRGIGADTLRELARVDLYDPEEDVHAVIYRDVQAMFRLQLSRPPAPPIVQGPLVWGGSNAWAKAVGPYGDAANRPDSWYYLWRSERRFKAHEIGAGLRLLGPDEVLPWRGSRVGPLVVQGIGVDPVPLPDWLADIFGQGAIRRATRTTTRERVSSAPANPYEAQWGDE